MSSLLADAAAMQYAASSPWPKNAKLYQPYEVEQVLMADFANCLSVKVFLKMCNLPFSGELRTNAEYMSPSGKVPFLQVGNMIVSEFQPIVTFVGHKGHNLSEDLTDEQRCDMKAFMALVENCLMNVELWISWCDKKVAKEVTRRRYGYPFAWPLNYILPFLKERQCLSLLKHKGWKDKSYDTVCEDLRICCAALSEKLGEQDFFFGKNPCELDALVFGHLYTMLSTKLPRSELAEIVLSFPNLSRFCTNIDDVYLKELELRR